MKIFILEDDESRIRLFVDALLSHGHDLTIAKSFQEATRKFQPPYDALSLDHDLGGRQFVNSDEEETGFNFVRWLGKAPSGAQPVIAVHSYNPDGAQAMINLLHDNGWVAVIKEPFGPKLLSWLSMEGV